MGTRDSSDEPVRNAPDGPSAEPDDRAKQRGRRRRRADEAGLQSLVRRLATRPADQER